MLPTIGTPMRCMTSSRAAEEGGRSQGPAQRSLGVAAGLSLTARADHRVDLHMTFFSQILQVRAAYPTRAVMLYLSAAQAPFAPGPGRVLLVWVVPKPVVNVLIKPDSALRAEQP